MKINNQNLPITIIAILTLLHWIILEFKIPIIAHQLGWFWHFISKPAGSPWLIGLLIIIIINIIVVITAIQEKYKTRLFLLMFFGVGLQFCFAFLEGRGIDGMRDRIIHTGHAEFAVVATQQNDILYAMTHYEELIEEGKLGAYANSKPPGTLLFYMLTKEIADFSDRKNDIDKFETLTKLRNTATFLWPLLSYLVLIPLFYFTSIISKKEVAILACGLYLVVPSVNLITLHTDQVIYPLLFMMAILISAIAAKQKSSLIALLSGTSIYLAAWFSFALIFVFPFIIITCYFILKEERNKSIYSYLTIFSCIIIGFLVTNFIFKHLLNYDALIRYERATQYHFGFKKWVGGIAQIIHFGKLNILEFSVWVGIPLIVLTLLSSYHSIVHIYKEKLVSLEYSQALILPAVLMLISFAGKTKGETARLCLFLVPYTCIVAANFIARKFGIQAWHIVAIVIFLQFGTIYFTKINQDFW